MNRLKCLLACLCLAASSLASAGVIYTWRTTALSPTITSATGFIELTEAAVASGRVSYTAPFCDEFPCDLSDPDSPILRFGFMVNNHTSSAINIDLIAGTGYNLSNPSFDAGIILVDGQITGIGLYINTLDSTLWIGGDSIISFSSDADNCHTPCMGAEGQFVRADIPEPAPLALLGLAGLGAALARRRQNRYTTHRHTSN